MTPDTVKEILRILGLSTDGKPLQVSPFRNEEDGGEYAVWKVEFGKECYVLKEAKARELEIYSTYLDIESPAIPRLYATARYESKDYLLMEYISGNPLLRLDRTTLTHTLDALIDLQKRYWNASEPTGTESYFEESLTRRIERGKHLKDATLERAYGIYSESFRTLPRTLCHDDLLPFNVIASEERAVIIDWEVAGLLPYPTAIARLLAHGEDAPDVFFFLTEADRKFAIGYYYENLLLEKGIAYGEYRRALDLCFLYEYCEWVMLGNKYGDTDTARYQRYFALAKELARKLLA